MIITLPELRKLLNEAFDFAADHTESCQLAAYSSFIEGYLFAKQK